MKKTVLFSAALALVLASCSSSTTQEPATTATPPAAEVPAPQPSAPATSAPAPAKSADGTNIEVSKDGLNVGTKKGDKESSVEVTEDNAKVTIKR